MPATARPIDTIRLALWFGTVAGLVEGTAYLALQRFGWANAAMWFLPASIEIVWIATVVNVAVFSLVGLALSRAPQIVPVPRYRQAIFIFCVMTFVILLQMPGKLHPAAVVILGLGLGGVLSRASGKSEPVVVRFFQRTLPAVVGTAVVTGILIQAGILVREQLAIRRLPTASPGSPNILLVVVDTLRADHLSAYQYPRATSPNIDRLARNSVWFENAVATSSWTLPSHASLVTGRYPYEHGAQTVALDSRYPTIGETLQHKGYRTAAFSANQYWFGRREGFGRGFIRFDDYFFDVRSMAIRPFYGRVAATAIRRAVGNRNLPARKPAAEVNRDALDWIRQDSGRPFFAMLNYFDAHQPYLPPEPYLTKFAASKDQFNRTIPFDGSDFTKMTPDQLQHEIDAYDGAINYIDEAFGRLMADLMTAGRATDTLIIVTSDHGESFGEHGMYTHRNALYLEGIRVPLILSWPGHFPSGVQVKQPVSITQVPATILDVLGDSQQTTFHGPSLVNWWKAGGPPVEREPAIAELAHQPDEPFAGHPVVHGSMRSVIDDRWHYIVHDKFGEQLYDWVNDPQELNNMVATPDGRPVADRFVALLRTKVAGVNTPNE
jgi:arylsulfatase A-like enzyme